MGESAAGTAITSTITPALAGQQRSKGKRGGHQAEASSSSAAALDGALLLAGLTSDVLAASRAYLCQSVVQMMKARRTQRSP